MLNKAQIHPIPIMFDIAADGCRTPLRFCKADPTSGVWLKGGRWLADGIYPGPKGLRERVLAMWKRSSAVPAEPAQEAARHPVKPDSPAPALRPPGMVEPRRTVWPHPANDTGRPVPLEKLSYIEDLKARIRGERREGRSLLRRDFDRERG